MKPVSPTRSTSGVCGALDCCARTAVDSATTQIIRKSMSSVYSLACIQSGVEQDAERSKRLTAPLWAEAQQHDVTIAHAYVQRGGAAIQICLADQIAGSRGRSRLLRPGQYDAREALFGFEHGARVHEYSGLRRHTRHDRMLGIHLHFDDGSAEEEFVGTQAGDDISDGEVQLLDGERARVAQAH